MEVEQLCETLLQQEQELISVSTPHSVPSSG